MLGSGGAVSQSPRRVNSGDGRKGVQRRGAIRKKSGSARVSECL